MKRWNLRVKYSGGRSEGDEGTEGGKRERKRMEAVRVGKMFLYLKIVNLLLKRNIPVCSMCIIYSMHMLIQDGGCKCTV